MGGLAMSLLRSRFTLCLIFDSFKVPDMTERERMAPERNASMGFGRRALGGLKALTKRKEEVSISRLFRIIRFY